MNYKEILDLIVSAIVIGAVGYFFWKFRQIDTHATKTELAETSAVLSDEIDELSNTIPDDYVTSDFIAQHAEEQRVESQRQTDTILNRVQEVKQDLGREIGEVKGNVKTLDERLHKHITEPRKAGV